MRRAGLIPSSSALPPPQPANFGQIAELLVFIRLGFRPFA
jgi:hypothetical protein